MRIFPLAFLCRWLMALGLIGLLGPAAMAQTQGPRSINPALTDLQYTQRKARLAAINRANQGPARPAMVSRVTDQPLPACFEVLDSISSPAAGGYSSIPRGDDNSFGPINLGFSFTLFGSTYNSVYINTNGNLSFGSPVSQYSPSGFPIAIPMVAGFWADVDTRPTNSGRVWYKVFPDRLVVTWNRVGYFSEATDKKNTFQIVLRANSANSTADNVAFSYGDMQWTTGSASDGNGGFGGFPATVGANRGTNNEFIQVGRFNRNTNERTDNVSPSGINWLDNQCLSYRLFEAGNLPPVASNLPVNNTITVNQGQTVTVSPQFSGPEAGQTIVLGVNTGGLCNVDANIGGGINPILNLSITGAPCNIGTSTISIRATDNGSPVATRQFNLTVIVNPAPTDGQWTGSVSTVYTNPANWRDNVVPSNAMDVVIPASAVRMPVLSATATARNFTVATGASMQVASEGTLTLIGTLLTNGSFDGQGVVRLTGATQQSLGGNSMVQAGTLSVGTAGARLTGPLAVSRLLTLNGNLSTSGQPLTLLSNAAGTAMVTNLGTAVVVGTATVQRYIDPSLNGGTGYRHYSAPVSNTTLLDLATGAFSPLLNTAYNTAANPGSVTPFPTLFGFDERRISSAAGSFDQGWFSPAATSEPLTPGVGYTVNLPATATVDFVGSLNNGTVTRTGLTRGTQPTSGWHLLGNPYPAPIDWALASGGLSGLDNAVYVFKSTGTYAGNYSSFVNGVGDARLIGMGQGFFVRTSTAGTAGSLTLTNAARVTSYENPAFNRTSRSETRPLIQLDVVNGTQRDAATLYFEQGATAGFDRAYDAYKVTSGAVASLAMLANQEELSINGQPALGQADVLVPLRVRVPVSGTYRLEAAQLLNLPVGTRAYLQDAETGARIDLAQQPTYSFQLNTAATAPRFSLLVTAGRLLATTNSQLSQQVLVFPNPAHGTATLTLPAVARSIAGGATLHNAVGQVVRTFAWSATSTATRQLSLQGLAPGVYLLHVATSAGPAVKRLIVE